MNPQMQTIPSQFRKDYFDFTLLKRRGTIALFSKTKPHFTRESFEVVVIQTYEAEERFGKSYPKRELMPSSETWGTYGWTYPNREDAEKRFTQLTGMAEFDGESH